MAQEEPVEAKTTGPYMNPKYTSKSPKLVNSSTNKKLQEQNGSVYQAIQPVKEP